MKSEIEKFNPSSCLFMSAQSTDKFESESLFKNFATTSPMLEQLYKKEEKVLFLTFFYPTTTATISRR